MTAPGYRISMSGHMTPGRALKNEQFFAESNASIVREAGERRQLHVDVICECAQIGCVARIPMTAREYDEAHTLPRQFVVTPGHEILGVERVVRREAGYLVVEKFAPTG